MPVTIPEVATTLPTEGIELLHVPPVDVVPSVVVCPSHTWRVPVTGAGVALTVTLLVT